MSNKIYFHIKFSHHVGFPPATVVAAADINDNSAVDPGEYIALTNKGLEWSGTLSFKRAAGTKKLRLVAALSGNAGATYEITVRDKSKKGKVLRKQSGGLTGAPQYQFLRLP